MLCHDENRKSPPCGEEQQRLEEGMGQQVKIAEDQARRPNRNMAIWLRLNKQGYA
jgi:hypothetical protein